ncbi:hypothetical protein ACH5RR_028129 [Cinchona calisaya]|uniref:Uncharacterized protein n=1 Tax=Cinchona calisaya TaxID=153742 RepID=A0ABD2YT71_9GENT
MARSGAAGSICGPHGKLSKTVRLKNNSGLIDKWNFIDEVDHGEYSVRRTEQGDEEEIDRDRAMNGRSYVIDNQLLILKRTGTSRFTRLLKKLGKRLVEYSNTYTTSLFHQGEARKGSTSGSCCGVVEHGEKSCAERRANFERKKSEQYVVWMRAGVPKVVEGERSNHKDEEEDCCEDIENSASDRSKNRIGVGGVSRDSFGNLLASWAIPMEWNDDAAMLEALAIRRPYRDLCSV